MKDVYTYITDRFANMVDLDFETRSELNIKEVGAYAYAAHHSTEILLMRYSIEDGKIYGWRKGDPFPKRLARALERGYQVRAHNWLFEYAIWLFCGKKLGWFPMPYERFDCTAALACRFGFPAGMEQTAEAMLLPVKKDKKGKQLIQKFSTPSARKHHQWNEPEEFPDLFNDFDDYCEDDVRVQMAIVRFVPHLLEPSEMAVFRHTQLMNMRGIPIDGELCEAADNLRIKAIRYANKEARLITKGEIKKIRSRDVFLNWIAKNKCPLPDTQADTIEKTLKYKKNLKSKVRRILELRKSASKTSVSKFKKAVLTTIKGLLHGGLLYYGASKTGRFAGRSLQPHNFARPTVKKWVNLETIAKLIKEKDFFSLGIITGDVMEALSSSLRSMIYAPEGKKLVVADYSQIEARFVFWFAGQMDALKDFRDGKDIYKVMACDIYTKVIDFITELERFVGKQAILGLGFQMGAPKFRSQCIDMADIDLGDEFTKEVVKAYRKKYSKVKELWKETNEAAINAVQNKGESFYCADGKIEYIMMDDIFLICVLPSGRKLYYPFAKIKMKEYYKKMVPELRYMSFDSQRGGWVSTSSYGGKLVENYVQATARDYMVGGMAKAEDAGYSIILTVHDEIIALVDEDFGSVEELEKVICVSPKWAKGFPAKAEGWQGMRYKK